MEVLCVEVSTRKKKPFLYNLVYIPELEKIKLYLR
jgi:hypothetical protein